MYLNESAMFKQSVKMVEVSSPALTQIYFNFKLKINYAGYRISFPQLFPGCVQVDFLVLIDCSRNKPKYLITKFSLFLLNKKKNIVILKNKK